MRPVASTALTILVALLCVSSTRASGPFRLTDDTDRSAFRAWFTFLADAEFEKRSPDDVDCASLVRHAYREALRAHTPEWRRRNPLPIAAAFPDVRQSLPLLNGTLQLFKIARDPDRFAEFADAATIVRLNARSISRDSRAARPGDLFYFHQDTEHSPDHLMVFVGESRFERTPGSPQDWLVYHTGPDGHDPGEVRKVSVRDLERHPSPRWRPSTDNPAFVGVFRLSILDSESQQ